MKSAFMSDIFHALRRGEPYTLPVSAQAQLWLMSVAQCARNLMHAVTLDSKLMPDSRAVTLPALRVSMAALAEAIATVTHADLTKISYAPDAVLEAAFGAHPPLATPAAEQVGLARDGSVEMLVQNALETLARSEDSRQVGT